MSDHGLITGCYNNNVALLYLAKPAIISQALYYYNGCRLIRSFIIRRVRPLERS